MSIGILYESHEWSSTALRDYIKEEEVGVELIDLEKDIDFEKVFKHDLIINRIFASAQFRGHTKSLKKVDILLDKIKKRNIDLINPYESHYYETSKYRTTQKLKSKGIPSPEIYCRFQGEELPDFDNISYPCVLKPDCGGRTNYTYILNNEKELKTTINELDNYNFDFIVQRYIPTSKGFTTRIEIIGDSCYSVMKRFVTEGGLAAYNLGSQYEEYEDCSEKILQTALRAMKVLNIEMGSLDIIEDGEDFYIIDVNSVSNFAPENIDMFGFNLIKDMAKYIVKRYKEFN